MMTPKLILEGLQHWNDKKYFEAHEAWEAYWHTIRKDDAKKQEADYVKGIIQLAVALVHYERGNQRWYHKLMHSAPALLQHIEHEPYTEIKRDTLISTAQTTQPTQQEQ